jgi:hypothetical protein
MNAKFLLILILIVILIYIIGTLIYLNSVTKWPVIFNLKNTGKNIAKISLSINGKFFRDISLDKNFRVVINDNIINWMNNLPLQFSDLLNISMTTDSLEKIEFSSKQNLSLYLNGKIVENMTAPGTFYIYF